jgi:uncharacterized protein DUF3106
MIWKCSTTLWQIRNRQSTNVSRERISGPDFRTERQETAANIGANVRLGKNIADWMARAVLMALLGLSLPSFAARVSFRAPQQQHHPAPNNPTRPPAPHPPARPLQQGHAGDWLRQHKNMPLNEQQRALQNDPQFRHLTPEQQQQLQQRLQHFSGLPPQQQQRMLNRMETWEHLTPEQKDQARQVFGQLRQLPPDRRRMVTSAVRDLRTMPPAQRDQIIDSDRFKGMFSPQERETIRGAARLPLAPPEGGEAGAPQQ